MKNLVIVESPTKARTISKFLGKEYEIRPSMGHVMDLPKSKLGIDLDDNFAPQYEVLEDKKKIITELKKLAKDAQVILLATDPDREGEAISANVKELLEGKLKAKFKRIVFHEITEKAIKEALDHPREVDENLVHAQTARRVLDRLVGYKLSPLLWKKVRRGLSAGRVQSVALRLIVEREREVEKFHQEPYWTIHGTFVKETKGARETDETKATEFDLIEINGEKIEIQKKTALYDGDYTISKTTIVSEEQANQLLADIKNHSFVVSDVMQRETKRSPYPPFTTSTLQQQASQRFSFPGKRTMSLAQKLYEEGFITYHRTDSVSLSPESVTQMRNYVEKEYGSTYIPEKPRLFFTKQKNAQEAHEAIRPTQVSRSANAVRGELGDAYAKLYDLIWKRAVASQMSDAKIESTTVFAESTKEKTYRFKTNGSVLLFDGFLKLTPQALEDKRLPAFISGENLSLDTIRTDPHQTTPPPRYNDASLIKTLEEKSIGRPSTYASIISTLTDRGYVERAERRFAPTSVGLAVNDFLVTNFSTIDDIPFTAQMENDLDLVASGEKKWDTMMNDFYRPFKEKLVTVEGAERVKIEVEETDEPCPECKVGKLVVRTGKFGKFLSCGRFPECKFTKPFVQATEYACPKDNGQVVMKKTRKGRTFFGCSNYPKCDFAVWKLEDIKKGTEAVKETAQQGN